MKCNIEKINQFFENKEIDQETKDFVLKLFRTFSIDDDYDPLSAKVTFLSLGFYEVEDNDDIEQEDHIIDFYKLSVLTPVIKQLTIELILKSITSSNIGDFSLDFLVKDTKVWIEYQDWKQINRKNKLESINKL